MCGWQTFDAISPGIQAKLDAVLPPDAVMKTALRGADGAPLSLSVDRIKNSSAEELLQLQQVQPPLFPCFAANCKRSCPSYRLQLLKSVEAYFCGVLVPLRGRIRSSPAQGVMQLR